MICRITALVLSGAACAFGQAPGDILITDNNDKTIKLISGPLNVTTLHTFTNGERPAGITQAPGGFYVANGPLPVPNPSNSSIIRIDGMFSGAPTQTTVASSDPIQNPIDIKWDRDARSFVVTNGPAQNPSPPQFTGMLSVKPNGSVFESLAQDAFTDPRPRFQYPLRMTRERGTGDWLVVGFNGGIYDDGQGVGGSHVGSTLHRYTLDPNSLVGAQSMIVDLSDTSVTGLADPLTVVKSITTIPGGDVMITEETTGTIYRIALNGDGSFGSITPFMTGLVGGGEIIYNSYTDKLVFGESLGSMSLSQVNLDGTGLELIASGVSARGITIVPSPGSITLLSVAGLLAMRRRR